MPKVTAQSCDVQSWPPALPSQDHPVTRDLRVEDPLQFQSLAAPTAIESSDLRASSSGRRPHPRAPATGETQDGHVRRPERRLPDQFKVFSKYICRTVYFFES